MNSPEERTITRSIRPWPASSAAASDESLIDQALAGDQRSYTLLFQRHERIIRAAIHRYLGPNGDIDECLQETRIRIFRALPGFRRECKLSSWLYQVAISTAINHCRRKAGRFATTSLEQAPEIKQLPGAIQTACCLEKADRAAWINHALGLLAEKDATVLNQYYLQEWSVEEICQATGLSESNIKTRLMRARRRLREVVENRFSAELLN